MTDVWFDCQTLLEVFMRIRTTAVFFVVCSLLWTSSAMAQQHVVAPAVLRQAIANQAATDQQNRKALLGVLQQSPSALQVWPVSAHCGPPIAVHWPLVAPGSLWQDRPKQQSPSIVQLDDSPRQGARQMP